MEMRRDARTLPFLSPVLVGRDGALSSARQRVEEALNGRGGLLLVSGEAGIGKSRLVAAIARHAALSGSTVVAAAAYPSDVEVSGGLLLDVAAALSRAATAHERALGEALRERLVAPVTESDPHRARRLATIDCGNLVARLAATAPAVVVLEDVHWSDDFSLEVFGILARRLPEHPLLAVAAYRSDELYPRVPVRTWRARLVNERLAEELRLSRLTLDETSVMAASIAGAPVSRRVVELVHQRSDGVPLHVEELLALIEDRDDPVTAVPPTLADAVLGRADALSDSTRRLVDVAAVIGRSFEIRLLATVAGLTVESLADPLGELESRFFVVPTRDAHGYDFRHALIRDALYAAISVPARRVLHLRVAQALASTSRGASDAVLSMHWELAGASEAAYRHAQAAAAAAARSLAHREAMSLYERALRNAPPDLDPGKRGAVLAASAAEAAASDDNAQAASRYEEARASFLAAGDRLAAAALLPKLAAARHLLGAPLGERVALLEEALAVATDIETAGDASAVIRAQALAGLAAAYMLDRRLEDAIRYAGPARAAATDAGLLSAELHASATLASVLVFAGKGDEGWALHQETVERGRAADRETETARAFRMAGSCASVLLDYDRAERWLDDGIAYAERMELWNDRHYMAAHRAHVAWATGDWDTAAALARRVLADGHGGVTTRVTALHVLGYVELGRGRMEEARAVLVEARAIGERMGELQRLSPAVWGLAESAVLDGRAADAIALCRTGLELSAAVGDAAYLFPFLVTGTRALIADRDAAGAAAWAEQVADRLTARGIRGTEWAIAHARGLVWLAGGATGHARSVLEEAVAGWDERRRIWEGTWARLDLARCHLRANRPAAARSLADAATERARELRSVPLLQEAGSVLRRADAADTSDVAWAPLTAREYDVARLIAAGKTNGEIAAELRIARKTASAHVEHILAKLDVSRRTEVAAWVASRPAGASPSR